MLGMGSGQPNRLESLRIAMRKAGDEVKGAALASDAFFPFGKSFAVICFGLLPGYKVWVKMVGSNLSYCFSD